jgi:serine/threonine protein kinase
VIIALIYLRQNNIIHRDIKPENLVFDSKGYLHLTDFGISKYITDPHKGIINKSGTIGYASPETIMGLNHSFASDYFSLGVIAYELLMGRRPFKGNNKQYIKEQLLTKSIKLKIKDIPNDLNINNNDKNDLCGLINKLLHRKNNRRLGVNNINEIIYHPFFKGFNWNALLHQEMKSPLHIKQNEQVHMSSSNIDNVNIDEYWDILNKINNEKYFAKFYFNSKHKNESPLNKNIDLNQSVLSLSGYSCFTPSNLKTYKRNSGMSSLSTKCD